ncbi:MAG: hypothetical protein EA415_10985 [Sphaerobacteraceae bacterium]|nr:MAG: hypothetical protein EA415_10985 [Sphaerobacteraceae bacterium]
MIEEHPRAIVIARDASPDHHGADILTIVSSEPRILHGLHRWWMDRQHERRAIPPMSIVQLDDTLLSFSELSADELEMFGRQEELPQAS